jgi:hypothetical protein
LPNDPKFKEELNASIAIDLHDPFQVKIINKILSGLSKPLNMYPNFHSLEGPVPKITVNKTVELGKNFFYH